MSEETILQTLRLQAWERAKGELNAVAQAMYPTGFSHERTPESAYMKLKKEFIEAVENEIG